DKVIVDGFDDDEPDTSEDSKLSAQLKKTQALYEKLKQGLLKRDEQIEQLQDQLGARSNLPEATAPELKAEFDAASNELREKITACQSTIDKLRTELRESRDEKDMLADMAKRRSQNNQALKQAGADANAERQKLEVEIETLSKTIGDREASIKRLLGEVAQLKATNETQQQQLTKLTADVAAHQQVLDQRDERIRALDSSLTEQQTHITALGQELHDTHIELQGTTATLQAREQTIAQQQAQADLTAEQVTQLREAGSVVAREHASAADATTKAHDLAASALNDKIEDREIKIQALSTQIDSMHTALNKLNLDAESFRQQASNAQALIEEQNKKLNAELSDSRRQADLLAREAHKAPHTEPRDMTERDALQLEIREQAKAHEISENAVRERDQQISMTTAKLERAGAELTEQHQCINVYKSVVQDQDFKLACLSDEIANLTRCLDLEKQASAETTALYDRLAGRFGQPDNNLGT
ncbi:MAG: hypothetical protein O7B25_13310, partial [Gammaproteobacteria bacterium]|nr:hypothetical protein [Gammaproteobacteria bacterium]